MSTILQSITDPETIVLAAGMFWMAASLATGLPHKRFPSEFPFLFALITVVSAMIGVTELVPESIDNLLTMTAVILFAVTPILITLKLYQAYPPHPDSSSPV